MKVALLLGVSEYQNLKDLPACKTDISVMKQLLDLTGNYDDILPIESTEPSTVIKDKIANWLETLKNKELDEFFFYYTGHGDFSSNEFYFLLHDYDEDKRNTTTITNSDLDVWIKSLQSFLTVKVIDACHSGISYIKGDSKVFKKYLDESGNNFKNCIFMFSSHAHQYSYAENISFFTKSFLDAVKLSQADTVRYLAIQQSIADDFTQNTDQTPYFVTQSPGTEIFTKMSDNIKNLIYPTISKENLTNNGKEKNEAKLTLKQIIEKDSKNYVKEEFVIDKLEKLRQQIQTYSFPEDFDELYNCSIKFLTSANGIKNVKYIGNWLNYNKHEFFAQATYKTEISYVEIPTSLLEDYQDLLGLGGFASIGRSIDKLTEKRQKVENKVLDGFKLTFEAPYSAITIDANPKYDSLPYYFCALTFLISNKQIRLLYYVTDYTRINWKTIRINENIKWKEKDSLLIESKQIDNLVGEIIASFIDEIMSNVKKQFQLE